MSRPEAADTIKGDIISEGPNYRLVNVDGKIVLIDSTGALPIEPGVFYGQPNGPLLNGTDLYKMFMPAETTSRNNNLATLGQTSTSLAPLGPTGQPINGAGNNWGNPATLQDHFDRHGGDFGSTNPNDYANQANSFYNNRGNYQVKVDANGVTRVYDANTNTFGAYNADGTTKTYFKPDLGLYPNYWADQPGK